MVPDAMVAARKTRESQNHGTILRFREIANWLETILAGAIFLLSQLAKYSRFAGRAVGIYRSLAIKTVLLSLIFLTVPIILYRLVQIGDAQQGQLLQREFEVQGDLIASVLRPHLEHFAQEPPETLQAALKDVVPEGVAVRVLVRPAQATEAENFLYVGSAPAVTPNYLKQERDLLIRLGLFDRMAPSCDGETGQTVRFTNPAGRPEILTSMRSLHLGGNCWVVITTQQTQAAISNTIGVPVWRSAEIPVALVIYLLSALIVAWLLWDLWRNLGRFRSVARAIRLDRAGGISFREMNTIPELTGVADDFDALVAALKQSKELILQAAEENAHALKAPLAVISQALEPLRRAPALNFNAQAQRSLELIEHSVGRLDSLVSAARDLEQASVEAIYPNLRRINLSASLVQLISAYEPTIALEGKNLRLSVKPNVHIYGADEAIESIVENLLENASSFTPAGGVISVILTAADGLANLVIADTGPGARNDDLPMIFERNFSARGGADAEENAARPSGQHYGLGLWIARRNVEALTGTISACNHSEGGFAVTIQFNAIP
ncbi:MAG TPA: HAMP domain-containing sensor histidine kinase [Micropepsaceae bacterium]|nr:HAMP domain-containing sensor histidine kinase [Micropepsaceae bacterium]